MLPPAAMEGSGIGCECAGAASVVCAVWCWVRDTARSAWGAISCTAAEMHCQLWADRQLPPLKQCIIHIIPSYGITSRAPHACDHVHAATCSGNMARRRPPPNALLPVLRARALWLCIHSPPNTRHDKDTKDLAARLSPASEASRRVAGLMGRALQDELCRVDEALGAVLYAARLPAGQV